MPIKKSKTTNKHKNKIYTFQTSIKFAKQKGKIYVIQIIIKVVKQRDKIYVIRIVINVVKQKGKIYVIRIVINVVKQKDKTTKNIKTKRVKDIGSTAIQVGELEGKVVVGFPWSYASYLTPLKML